MHKACRLERFDDSAHRQRILEIDPHKLNSLSLGRDSRDIAEQAESFHLKVLLEQAEEIPPQHSARAGEYYPLRNSIHPAGDFTQKAETPA
jgi:hypothetical protein